MPKKVGAQLVKRKDSKYWQYYFCHKGAAYRGSTGEEDDEKAGEVAYRIWHDTIKKDNTEHERDISISEMHVLYLEHVEKELRANTSRCYRPVVMNWEKFLREQYPQVKLVREIEVGNKILSKHLIH